MRHRWRDHVVWLGVLTIALTAVAACGDDDGGDTAGFEGVEWQLVELSGEPVPEGTTPSLTLDPDAGSASGDAGCNRFTGQYQLDGTEIEIGPLATTLMACIPGVDEFEQAYLEALGRAASVELIDEELVLSLDGGGTLRYVSL